jgi:hypothetical protein
VMPLTFFLLRDFTAPLADYFTDRHGQTLSTG